MSHTIILGILVFKTVCFVSVISQCCDLQTAAPVHHDCRRVDGISVTNIETIDGHRFTALCRDRRLVIARRFDGSVSFDRTWEEYKNGFGDPKGEYFIGFDNLIALLHQKRYGLRVELTTWDCETKYAHYSGFCIDSEAKKYKLRLSNYYGTAGDGLMERHSGMQFSTKDRDNDNYSGNCAKERSGAYWYDDCTDSDLTGSNLFGHYST
ncbi:unnamed protein product, partial [Owenia fusiformis]